MNPEWLISLNAWTAALYGGKLLARIAANLWLDRRWSQNSLQKPDKCSFFGDGSGFREGFWCFDEFASDWTMSDLHGGLLLDMELLISYDQFVIEMYHD